MNIIEDYFAKLRHDEKCHIGLGDIRLTIGMQEDLMELVNTHFLRKNILGILEEIFLSKLIEPNDIDNGFDVAYNNGIECCIEALRSVQGVNQPNQNQNA